MLKVFKLQIQFLWITALFKLSLLTSVTFRSLYLLRNSFHLSCKMYLLLHVVCGILYYHLNFALSIVISSLSFLIFVISVIFFFWSVQLVYQIYWLFSRNLLFISLSLSTLVLFVCFSFWLLSHLYFSFSLLFLKFTFLHLGFLFVCFLVES